MEYLDCINHRGPDDHGWVNWNQGTPEYGKSSQRLNGNLIQGHTRLSILDLSDLGWQPMASECGNFSLVYNGEIYNYLELKVELESLGFVFRSNTDTEVLLYSLIQWGELSLPKLRGMFAFTFFDAAKKELLVARDFFGIKPLYYSCVGDNIIFSSEVSSILLNDDVSKKYNPQMIYEYLLTGASDHTTSSMYQDINQFPSASYSKIKIDGKKPIVNVIRYWDIDLNNKITPSFDEAVREVRRLFLDSVKIHMRSDVVVGAALSGGIDSSAIVCCVKHLYPEKQLHTFSFIAEDESLSEEKWIDIVNQHVNAKVHKIQVNREELVEDLDDLMVAQGEPFGSTSIYAQYRVFKEAKEKSIKVMLDGQGADEMLAGYIFFQASVLAASIRKLNFLKAYKFFNSCVKNTSSTSFYLFKITVQELLPSSIAQFLKKNLISSKKLKWLSTNWLFENAVSNKNIFRRKVNRKAPLKGHLKSNLLELGIPHLLRYEDRNSMRWSVESRVPFLDVDLVEYIYSLPEEYIINNEGLSKYVFREAMRGIVPDEILDRKDKIGFSTPEKSWLTKMDLWVKSELDNAVNFSMFDLKNLKSEWSRVLKGEVVFDFRCWRWINLIAWLSKNEK